MAFPPYLARMASMVCSSRSRRARFCCWGSAHSSSWAAASSAGENDGAEEVLARVLFRLTARRGAMPFLPGLGSRLHEVIREKPGARQTLCARYVAQALEEETDLSVTDVVWQDTEEGAEVTVSLEWKGQPLTVTAAV